MSVTPPPVIDKEIDMHAILQTLWKARVVILITTLAVAVIAFVYSYWIMPHTYQATTYMFIGQPSFEFSNSSTTSGFAYTPTLPDIKAVVGLSTAPGILEAVLKDPAIVAAMDNKKIDLSELADMVTAVDLGKDQLRLQVTDTDPQRAALLANTWAEKVATMVNGTYGPDTLAQTLNSQLSQAQAEYIQAQASLEETIAKSKVDSLKAQLDSEKSDLADVLASTVRTKSVLDDLQFFEQGLGGIAGETPLALGDGLALTTLRQRALTVASESFTVQIDSASFTGLTVSKALEATSQMRTGLQTQLTRLQSDQSGLEQEIPQLQRDLEDANAQLSQVSLKRDQSLGLYTSLLSIQQQVTTVLSQEAKVASVSVKAVAPVKAISRKTLMNTALAGIAGVMLSVFWVLALKWWRNE